MPIRTLRHHRPFTLTAACGLLLVTIPAMVQAQAAGAGVVAPGGQFALVEAPAPRLFIREYRVTGAKQLPRLEIERAVYPFLGPARTRADVDQACAALQEVYRSHGYQTVVVAAAENQPAARVRAGIIELQVQEGTVGRLRVVGARFSSPKAIAAEAPSLAEGRVPDFQALPGDFLALNQVPGRQIMPELRPGSIPGTVDVDLKVAERLPVRAGVELNNRYSADTTKLRLNASFGLQNLWQAGHTFGLSYQVAPERRQDSEVFSGYYQLPLGRSGATSLMLQGTKQNSDVSTLGAVAVSGRGTTAGIRLLQTLPVPEQAAEPAPAKGDKAAASRFFHSVSFGLDYKRYNQRLTLAPTDPTATGDAAAPKILFTPTTQFPLAATYSLYWQTGRWTTEFNTGATLHLRGLGSTGAEFNDSRYLADGGFFYYRADLTETVRLPWDFRVQTKLQGQVADRPLLSAEQSSGGGLGTVRGYYEAEASGDNAAFASLELRSPSLLPARWGEWRFHGFVDWGWLGSNNPLPEEISQRRLLSYGGGTRFQIGQWFTGSLDIGVPLLDGPRSKTDDVRVTFRAGVDY